MVAKSLYNKLFLVRESFQLFPYVLYCIKLITINCHNILVILGYLKGYVYESSVVPSMMHCQMRCDTLHIICKSLNYIANEDGSNVCEINHEAQYCALPGNFIVKENSFYVETILEKDDAVSVLLLWLLINSLQIL